MNGWTFLEPPKPQREKTRCRCGSCGGECLVQAPNVLNGLSRRCRSCSNRIIHTTHGDSDAGGQWPADPLYRVWKAMKWRCNPKNTSRDARWYHGKGVAVNDAWRSDYPAFRDWALANGYATGLSIDRKDVGKGYSPDNCRWATPTEQARNTRRNVRVSAFGETKTVAEWAGRSPPRGAALHALRPHP